jgi:arylformamidase
VPQGDRRVVFDFAIEFTNGGGIQGQDFRLDIAGEEIDDGALADYIVADLRLLMVGAVHILNKRIIVEPHKRKPMHAPVEEDRFVDLSHTITDGLRTYKGLPAPIICDELSREASRALYEPGTEFQIGKLELVTNTGTYLDCPFHRYADGADTAGVALDALADLPAIVVRADHQQVTAIDASFFRDRELRGRAVLVHTGWSEYFTSERYFEGHLFLTADATAYLRDCGVTLVGIDSHNIDDTSGRSRPVHSALLGADILIVEHLTNLAALPDEGFCFSAVPPKIAGVGTFPVRAFARLR